MSSSVEAFGWDVEAITDHRKTNGRFEFLVKWTNVQEKSWQPYQDFFDFDRDKPDRQVVFTSAFAKYIRAHTSGGKVDDELNLLMDDDHAKSVASLGPVYIVDRIVASQTTNNDVRYYVRWTNDTASWQPEREFVQVGLRKKRILHPALISYIEGMADKAKASKFYADVYKRADARSKNRAGLAILPRPLLPKPTSAQTPLEKAGGELKEALEKYYTTATANDEPLSTISAKKILAISLVRLTKSVLGDYNKGYEYLFAEELRLTVNDDPQGADFYDELGSAFELKVTTLDPDKSYTYNFNFQLSVEYSVISISRTLENIRKKTRGGGAYLIMMNPIAETQFIFGLDGLFLYALLSKHPLTITDGNKATRNRAPVYNIHGQACKQCLRQNEWRFHRIERLKNMEMRFMKVFFKKFSEIRRLPRPIRAPHTDLRDEAYQYLDNWVKMRAFAETFDIDALFATDATHSSEVNKRVNVEDDFFPIGKNRTFQF